ncbi:MAG: hypothetical protein QI223_08385 [Candidatus Korarchaeota archaeon]|nr:hypothetical protein [Candidatus Korarchaeota archaeon]
MPLTFITGGYATHYVVEAVSYYLRHESGPEPGMEKLWELGKKFYEAFMRGEVPPEYEWLDRAWLEDEERGDPEMGLVGAVIRRLKELDGIELIVPPRRDVGRKRDDATQTD